MLQNSSGTAAEQFNLLRTLSTELIKNVEGRLQTDSYGEQRILEKSRNREEAMREIKLCRRKALLQTAKCDHLCFNFDMCDFIYYEIADYLKLPDLVALTSTCRKASNLLGGYRIDHDRYNAGTYSWMQRCRILNSNAKYHILLGGVHEKNSPISTMVTCMKDRFLVVGGYDGNISIWETTDTNDLNPDPASRVIFPTCRKVLRAHDGWVMNLVEISSSLIASFGKDGSVKIWCIAKIVGVNCNDSLYDTHIHITAIRKAAEPKSRRHKSFLSCIWGFMDLKTINHDESTKRVKYMPTKTPPNYRLYNGVLVERIEPLTDIKRNPEHVMGICPPNSSLHSEGFIDNYKIVPLVDHTREKISIETIESNRFTSILSSYQRLVVQINTGISNMNASEGDYEVKAITALKDGTVIGISNKGKDISVLKVTKWVSAYRPTFDGGRFRHICPLPNEDFIVSKIYRNRVILHFFRKVEDITAPLSNYSRQMNFQVLNDVDVSSMLALDNRYLLIGGMDRSLYLYDLIAESMVGKICKAHSSFVTSLSYLPTLGYIVSGSLDGSIRFTNLCAFGSIELTDRKKDDNDYDTPSTAII